MTFDTFNYTKNNLKFTYNIDKYIFTNTMLYSIDSVLDCDVFDIII